MYLKNRETGSVWDSEGDVDIKKLPEGIVEASESELKDFETSQAELESKGVAKINERAKQKKARNEFIDEQMRTKRSA